MLQRRVDKDTLFRARHMLLDMHVRAGIGHVGGNLSCLDILIMLFLEIKQTADIVVLSKGHSAGALYVCLALSGVIPVEELKTFHADDTRLPGHPPINTFEQIPFATGSLGHGLSLAAGLALACRFIEPRERQVYCVMSDGEWQEGSTWEALWFISHQNITNLTIVIDANGLQGLGSIEQISSMTDLDRRIAAHGVNVQTIDGHDIDALRAAFVTPQGNKPRLILARTIKGRGVPSHQGRMESHYDPVKLSEVAKILERKFAD